MEKRFEEMTTRWLKRAHVYTGSIGPAFHDFRYRLEMDEKEGVVRAAAYSKLCWEKADDVEKESFAWDDAGTEQLRGWLQSRYEAFLAREAANG